MKIIKRITKNVDVYHECPECKTKVVVDNDDIYKCVFAKQDVSCPVCGETKSMNKYIKWYYEYLEWLEYEDCYVHD